MSGHEAGSPSPFDGLGTSPLVDSEGDESDTGKYRRWKTGSVRGIRITVDGQRHIRRAERRPIGRRCVRDRLDSNRLSRYWHIGDQFIELRHVRGGDRKRRRSSGRRDVVRHGPIGHGSHKRRSRRDVCDGHWNARSERRLRCRSAGLRRRKRRRSAHRRSEWSRPIRRWHRSWWEHRSRRSWCWFPVRHRHAGIPRSEFRWIVNRIAWVRHARCKWPRFHRPTRRGARYASRRQPCSWSRQEQTRRPPELS